ncbi:MAG: tetratricopeptide repeat protein [Pseudanabaena sp. SU_2_4]|nr:tetratricopeptide repeat protein [Pseudanabaena sp. SU_2_4]
MKKTIRLHHLLLKLVIASILLSSLDYPVQAQTFTPERSGVILLSQTSAEDFLDRGISLFEQKRYQEAIASLDKAVQIKPDFAEAWNNRGIALNELKRYDEAIASYNNQFK